MDCGPACLKMVARHYGRTFSMNELREKCRTKKNGSNMLGISDAAESIGFRTVGLKVSYDKLADNAQMPCIVHWNQKHFVVVYRISDGKVTVADPATGVLTYSKSDFLKCWLATESNGSLRGFVLLLEPTPQFYHVDTQEDTNAQRGVNYIIGYLRSYRGLLYQLFLGMLLGSLIQLVFPFLTQSVVDVGINTQNVSFIYIVLAAQLMLFLSRTVTDFFKRWIILHLSTHINLSIVSDFLVKMMKLPMGFFDSRNIGDILQRIGDHTRIETFISTSSLSIIFSSFNLIIYGIVLATYHVPIFLVFFGTSCLYAMYVVFFLKARRKLDYKRFNVNARNQLSLIQLINGMQEIKLHNSERSKRWEWERIQATKFRINVSSIRLQQWQEGGSLFINELKNIVITFMSATAVINGEMTLGMMLAVQYIIGQLNTPISDFVGFSGVLQDARISLDRIGEIHSLENEEQPSQHALVKERQQEIILENVSFQYDGPDSAKALDEVNLTIETGKVTAIVGSSGSGKTTLLKLLLHFFQPTAGKITLGDEDLRNLSPRDWRNSCGVVMQDGFIFSDTIIRNICVNEDELDMDRVRYAARMANIEEFIKGLPLNYYTRIGPEGTGISAGQRQRILIARAVYKDPDYLFFDEATSVLDANNERVIIENLEEFYKGRTVVIIAHRLSTVKNADKIVVLDNGKIVEEGSHVELTVYKGAYYELVKNQLELGD